MTAGEAVAVSEAAALEAEMPERAEVNQSGVLSQPLSEARAAWRDLLERCADGSIYHSERWLELLHRAYGLELRVESIIDGTGRALAGGVFAKSKNPFRRALIALPFSDSCTLLGPDRRHLESLAAGLAKNARSRLEVRGYGAFAPWQVSTTFAEWSLSMECDGSALNRGMDRNFRRQIRLGEKTSLETRVGRGPAEVRAFHELMFAARSRLGLPVQPLGFFYLMADIFGTDCEIWLGAAQGVDCVGMLLLRDRETLYCKYSARGDKSPPGANHLLFWRMLETHAGRFKTLNLGRGDVANDGLNRFKHELGATAAPLPYSYFPRQPARVSSEKPLGLQRAFMTGWQRLPRPVTRFLGPRLYPYLT